MLIERTVGKYIVFNDDDIVTALQKISSNKSGVAFVLTQNGLLEGILTDGDIRRWILQSSEFDLNASIFEVCNKNFVSSPENADPADIARLFSDRIKFIPLVDKQQRLVAVATPQSHVIEIAGHEISPKSSTFIIAEIGNNHNGDINLAKKLVDSAVKAGANCAKFQLRDMSSLYRRSTTSEDLGTEYTLDLLKKYQLPTEQLFEVFDYCKQRGIIPLCTPWDFASLQLLEQYGLAAYKVASADLTNHEFLSALAKTGKPLICSTGMSNEAEIKSAISILTKYGSSFVILHCNSTYPAPFKDINLNYLSKLKQLVAPNPIGYSGHERGISIAIAAVSLGAKVVEKHLTSDRSLEGNDHKVSLLPDEFCQMVQGIREVELAMGSSEVRLVTQGEMMNREILGKSLIANREIVSGEIINESDIEISSPGRGLAPYHKDKLVGKVAKRDIPVGDFFYPTDIESARINARPYQFERPFGIPVRYHDFIQLLGKSNFDLVEFHFSYRDLALAPTDHLGQVSYSLDFVVHSPELFAADHVLDLCAKDDAYRARSINELQRVINLTRDLKPYFSKSRKPMIIVNAGGFSMDAFIPEVQRHNLYQQVAKSLAQLDTQGVEIIIQTMPPYPWHFGGQRYHNLFMQADEIVKFCTETGYKICLDISHSKLACNLSKYSFNEFIEKVAPFCAHLHIVDAKGIDGEGLQIGDGDIDFKQLCQQLNQLCPDVSFIPEIWQGHKNSGEGFWVALERLEDFFASPRQL